MRITSTDISGNVSDKTYIIVKDVTNTKATISTSNNK